MIKEPIKIKSVADSFGDEVFSLKAMKKHLSDETYKSLRATIKDGRTLDAKIADEVAGAMKNWALAKGATHFTHWFQPLTGATAEKHDSFLMPDGEGGALMKFSGKELIQGEPDASSFPSGGLRATFEARGYTVWDPTSPAFIKRAENTAILCIPTMFYSYTGEALDKKIPLLRSMDALSRQVCRLADMFGIPTKGKRAACSVGPEQEYFLIDKDYYLQRIDLMQTGRTLFGCKPAKNQQMEDHYFGAIRNRILNFMEDLDQELWKLGVPSKTRHNEVAPAQFEMAPMYEEMNLAVDHNMIVMETIRQVADRHGLVCLLHEKPFAGINGSGKHNNWSINGPDGKNWLNPGTNPHDNAVFITMICALMKAIDTHQNVLRAAVASAGNDHRLGANEAPPAIISIFLGEQLTDIISQIENGSAKSSKSGGVTELGVTMLPPIDRDVTDRNRTSPFAFTGNKFEFRALGSSMSPASSNIILNTIVADAICDMCDELEGSKNFNKDLQALLQSIVKKHKRILFNGDNYTEEWHQEAAKRGLLNLKTTPESLAQMEKESTVKLFEKHKVLSKGELYSRNEIYKEQYEKIIRIEASVALKMAKTLFIPSALQYLAELSELIESMKKAGSVPKTTKELLGTVSSITDKIFNQTKSLESAIKNDAAPKTLIADMSKLRDAVDALEAELPGELWPVPTYEEMLFTY